MKVAVLGASPKEDRYANKVLHRLQEKGHEVVGVNPSMPGLGNIPVVKSIEELPEGIHTLTVYVSPDRSAAMADAILQGGFRRVVFNPGAENPELSGKLQAAGVDAFDACSLVMLSTGQWGE